MHDDTLHRTTGDMREAEALDLVELRAQKLRAADGRTQTAVTMEGIPTLLEALEAGRNRVYFDLDVKAFNDLEAVATFVASNGFQHRAAVKTPVQNQEQAVFLGSLQARTGVMVMPQARFTKDNADELIALLHSIEARVVEAKFDTLSTLADRSDRFRRARIAVWVNTLNPVACEHYTDAAAMGDPGGVWGQLVKAGVSIIQTDEIGALVRYRQASR